MLPFPCETSTGQLSWVFSIPSFPTRAVTASSQELGKVWEQHPAPQGCLKPPPDTREETKSSRKRPQGALPGLWGFVPVGLELLLKAKLHPPHSTATHNICRTLPPSQSGTRVFFPIKHLAEGVLGAGGAWCSHPQQRCQQQLEPKPTELGFPPELHNLGWIFRDSPRS